MKYLFLTEFQSGKQNNLGTANHSLICCLFKMTLTHHKPALSYIEYRIHNLVQARITHDVHGLYGRNF